MYMYIYILLRVYARVYVQHTSASSPNVWTVPVTAITNLGLQDRTRFGVKNLTVWSSIAQILCVCTCVYCLRDDVSTWSEVFMYSTRFYTHLA